jgi:hypothetical protein
MAKALPLMPVRSQQPKWTPLPRSTGTTDANEHRRSYLTSLKNLQGEPISA